MAADSCSTESTTPKCLPFVLFRQATQSPAWVLACSHHHWLGVLAKRGQDRDQATNLGLKMLQHSNSKKSISMRRVNNAKISLQSDSNHPAVANELKKSVNACNPLHFAYIAQTLSFNSLQNSTTVRICKYCNLMK